MRSKQLLWPGAHPRTPPCRRSQGTQYD